MRESGRDGSFLRENLAGILFFVLLAGLLLLGLRGVRAGNESQGRELLEDTLRRAAVTCYAVEGSYPESLEYLAENYHVSVDTERYTVFYEVYASNLMPEITVVSK